MPTRPVRKLRHWRQQFREDAGFVLRRPLRIFGEDFDRGHVLTDEQVKAIGRTKIRRWWESRTIELAEIDERGHGRRRSAPEPAPAPVVEPEPPPVAAEAAPSDAIAEPAGGESGPTVEDLGGGWYALRVDDTITKVQGRERLAEVLAEHGLTLDDEEA